MGTIFTIVGGIIGIVMFFAGRQSAAKSEGVTKGRLMGDIEYIRNAVDELKSEFRNANIPELRAKVGILEKAVQKNEEAIRRVHERIDNMNNG